MLSKSESVAFLATFASMGYALYVAAPDLSSSGPSGMEMLAILSAVVVAIVLPILRWLPMRRLALERAIYAFFLAAMPFVYFVPTVLQNNGHGMLVEAIGIPIFVGLAVFGYFRSYPALGIGILAHGAGWDLWHHGSTSYIAAWYPSACLLADLALGSLSLTQRDAHRS